MHDNFLALDQTMVALERLIAPPHPEDAPDLYGYEPLPLPLFLAGMEVIGSPGARSFLDAGCGIGTKMHVARMLGWNIVAGIERHSPYIEIAKRLCPWASVGAADARDFDSYERFDVVYSYRLCIDDNDQRSLESLIVSHMRPGTLAFFPQGLSDNLGESLGVDVWRIG